MRVVDWIGVLATSVGLIGTAGAAGVWVADKRYVTHDGMIVKEIRDLERQVNVIKKKEKYNLAQPYELDIKIDLESEIRALQRELQVD